MKKTWIWLGLSSMLLCCATFALTLTFPNTVTTLYTGIDTQYSPVNFHVQNAFGGMFFWRSNVSVAPTTLQLSPTQTVTGCTEQLRGLYYNSQRWLRLWPLDANTLSGLQSIDSGYNTMTLSGGLFTNCSGKPAGAVYGNINHYRGNHEFSLIGGVNYNFATKMWLPSFGQTLYKYSNQSASGWIFDSQGAIGQMLWSFQCGNTILEAGEQCDDGNANNNDSCTNSCIIHTPPVCGNNIVEAWEQCDGGNACNTNCTKKTWWGGPTPTPDTCPDGDYSSSYYDGSCGTVPPHDAPPIPQPVGKACIYSDAQYLAKGPFTDTITHRWYPYTELMRISCLHRGRGTSKGLWIYEPDGNITRAEAIKTFVKILGIWFKDFTITTEDKPYPTPTQFADVGQNYWFAWYVDYAARKGLLDGLVTSKDGKQYLQPDKEITRYEAIKLMMLAYDMIDKSKVALTGTSVMGDVIDANSPYYQYIRKAEILGFISGVPQKNGGYNFEGQRDITRAEFAKIVSVPFGDQMFDILDLVQQSGLYRMVIESINKAKWDKTVFAFHLFAQLESISSDVFIREYKVQKKLFLETLKALVMKPLMETQGR